MGEVKLMDVSISQEFVHFNISRSLYLTNVGVIRIQCVLVLFMYTNYETVDFCLHMCLSGNSIRKEI